MGDEYTVLIVFLAGVIAQGTVVSGGLRAALGVLLMALVSLSAAWGLVREDPDPAFAIPVLATLLFVILFALFFRERLLPRLSGALLLHYSLLAVYGALSWAAGRTVPGWVIVLFSLPVLLSVYLAVSPREPGRFVKVLAYAWFLLVVTVLLALQLAPGQLKDLYDAEGFSASLYAWVFLGGMIFLHVSANLLYLLMLLPLGEGRSSFWNAVLGDDPYDEHVRLVAGRVAPRGWSTGAACLLAVHLLVLVANLKLQLLAPGLFVNGVLAGLALSSTTWQDPAS